MEKLLQWYDAERRILPWRESEDPYHVWLSEIMLQQTQVQTALPYFEAFVKRFPTVKELAAAEVEEVLALWSGLGYYRRARWLHRAAVQVAEQGGEFPRQSSELIELPGVGPYTAAAIASIAFGEVTAVLDGNVERVLCRLLALPGDPKSPAIRRRLLAEANARLDPDRPGDGNQAMMELGARICRPKAPRCGTCPLNSECAARIQGEPERFPTPRRRRRVEKMSWAVAFVRDSEERFLLFKRPKGSPILPGMWEFPCVDLVRSKEAMEAQMGGRYGGSWCLHERLGCVQHNITYRQIEAQVFRASLVIEDEVHEGLAAAWVRRDALSDYATSSLVQKILGLEEA